MDRPFDLDVERLRDQSPSALEDVNREPFWSGLKGDA